MNRNEKKRFDEILRKLKDKKEKWSPSVTNDHNETEIIKNGKIEIDDSEMGGIFDFITYPVYLYNPEIELNRSERKELYFAVKVCKRNNKIY